VPRKLWRPETVAAVLAEPFLGAGGVRPAAPGFLAALESVARANGTLFVLDEVQALRVGPHGAQDLLGLNPDLTILGKIIGGGFPIGAVGGRADLMNLTVASLTPDHVAHAGTFNGHLAAVVAGRVTLDRLDASAIHQLNEAAATLADRIRAASAAAGIAAELTRAGSILNLHLDDPAHCVPLHLALLLEGVYATPRGMVNLSTALTEADLRDIAAAYERALERIAG
jgi:glutamate-1-semialdehyde 2,1-aminomutase